MKANSEAGGVVPKRPRRRRFGSVLVYLAGAALLAFVAALPFAGRFLVVEDPLQKADAIVVLSGSVADRWLEAADLYREGLAPYILLSPGRIDRAEEIARQRGVRLMSGAEVQRDALRQLNVPDEAISAMPGSVDNTADEASAAHHVAARNGWTRLIVVTSKYHSRRTRFAFRREFRGTPVTVLVRASRYDEAAPDDWWRHRFDIRYVSEEYQKLLLYRLGLGR